MGTESAIVSKRSIHAGTGSNLPAIPNIENLNTKQQKAVLVDFFLKANAAIAQLDLSTANEEKALRKINKEIKETPLMKKLKSRRLSLKKQNELKEELRARYSGGLEVAKALGIDIDFSNIKLIEG